jgi:hypothetical protein
MIKCDTLIVYNLPVALSGDSGSTIYHIWNNGDKYFNWAPNHPLANKSRTYLSNSDDYIYSADITFGPVLVLCDSQ